MFRVIFNKISAFSIKSAVSFLMLVILAGDVWANQFYRYQDADGKVVISLTIPPELVSKGYDVLNSSGRLIERVAPALTPEQIKARDAALEQERLAEIERKKQEAHDAQLKQWYGEPDTAVRVLKRQATEIINIMRVELAKIERLKREIEADQSQAADLQRRGLQVPETIFGNISRLEAEIQQSKGSIADRRSNYQDVLVEFDGIIKRLEIINNVVSESYTPLLQNLDENLAELNSRLADI